VPLGSPGLAQAPDHPTQAAALACRSAAAALAFKAAWCGRRCGRRSRRLRGCAPGRLPFPRRRNAGWPAPSAPPRRPRGSFGLGDGGRRSGCRRRGFDRGPCGSCRPAPPAPSRCGGSSGHSASRSGRLLRPVTFRSGQVPSDLGPDLTFGAQSAIRGVNVNPPDHDRGRRCADRWPFLCQGPAGVDGFACVDRSGELPVEPLPLLHGRHRHVDRAEPDRHCHEQGRRRHTGMSGGGFDREGREIARDPGEKRDLRFGNSATAGGPFAA
jgi:hypothetical protein